MKSSEDPFKILHRLQNAERFISGQDFTKLPTDPEDFSNFSLHNWEENVGLNGFNKTSSGHENKPQKINSKRNEFKRNIFDGTNYDTDEDVIDSCPILNEHCKKLPSQGSSVRSKHSSSSVGYNKSPMTYLENTARKTSSVFMDDQMSATMLADEIGKEAPDAINLVMLLGMALGLLVTKGLACMDIYLSWLQKQIIQMKNVFTRGQSASEFFNSDDDTQYSGRLKLLLSPLLATFAILYGFIYILKCFVKFLLAPAPIYLAQLIQQGSAQDNVDLDFLKI